MKLPTDLLVASMRQIRISCKYKIIVIGGKYLSISESEGNIVVMYMGQKSYWLKKSNLQLKPHNRKIR